MSETTYNLEEAKARITRVFQFLQELHRVKTPPTVHLERYAWRFDLDALPNCSTVQRGSLLSQLELQGEHDDSQSGDFIVKVARPQETECPPPSVIIQQWLQPGWNEPKADPQVFAKRRSKSSGREESFEDSRDRVTALEQWLDVRRQWSVSEKKVTEALDIFSSLFDLWGRFARESEKYQLYLGDGILVMERPEGPIWHPLLLQRVNLHFNPSVPEFTIRESRDFTHVYTPLLRHLGVDGKDLHELGKEVFKQHIHPLGAEPTSLFFKGLVQRLWQDGHYFENQDEIIKTTGPYIYRHPLIYLGGSNQGFAEAIDRFLEYVHSATELPEAMLRVCGIETGREYHSRDDETPHTVDLLLTKNANPEQELVIRRLEETGTVLVQGPPGTGKSHTIANLIGHLLAQNKSILVTSHTSKALRIVREQVAAPLRSLCVSVFYSDEESNKELEESITGIVNYIATTSQKKLKREIEQLSEKRDALKARHADLRRSLLNAMTDEYRDIQIGDELIDPSSAARRLIDFEDVHDWIPGPVQENAELPLSEKELRDLYAVTARVSEEGEQMVSAVLPDHEKLPSPQEFAAIFDDINRLEQKALKSGSENWLHENQTTEMLEDVLARVQTAVEVLQVEDEWLLECFDAGRQADGERDSWMALVRLIEECCQEIPPREELILAQGPKLDLSKPLGDLVTTCRELVDYLESGKKLKRVSTLLKPEWAEFIECARVDEGPPTKVVHFQALLNDLEVRQGRENLLRRWDRQMETLNAPPSTELGRKPEKTAKQYADKIRSALNWHDEMWVECERAFEHAGIDWKRIFSKAPLQQASYGQIIRIRDAVNNQLLPLIEKRKEFLQWQALGRRRDEWIEYLEGFSKKDRSYPLIKALKHGIRKANYDTYCQARRQLFELVEVRPAFERRRQLLERLDAVAPNWTKAIREHKHPHDKGEIPGDVEAAWRYRQWEQRLDQLNQIDLDALQRELNSITEQLHDVTAAFVERLAWLAQLQRTGLRQQQALNGWLALHKKMGKGTGKHVQRLKEEARKTLIECRAAVPVWIMPLSRVIESFDLSNTRFDVVIVDEASQSDVLGLVAFAIGKEVAVVGDHEQVSPYAVGTQLDTIQGLIDEMLLDIPNKQLYDGKTSVYDLARQSFGGTIRLLEHFRCVPDIIQFSNQLCYGGEIRPLRETSASKIEPHLIEYRVKGGESVNKVNKEEGLVVASLVDAMCRLDEYEDCTIGVICMVGTEQALYIDSILRRRLTVAQYQRRRLLCGNASQFQGDERDVMLLSMVDSPKSKPLPLRQRDDAVKVFNVAASRARDQMWVVHSLNPERDLKPGDLRLKLIRHAVDPTALRTEVVDMTPGFSTEFEELVFEKLTKANFRTIQHSKVGEYVVDLVVEGGQGKRVAIQCDGDRRQDDEEIAETMERQLTLERLGWKFIRLRGSEFFRNPDEVIKKLARRLKEVGIEPVGPKADAPPPAQGEDLREKVIKRAELIRSRWKEAVLDPAQQRKTAA